jgi:hypothetical protein
MLSCAADRIAQLCRSLNLTPAAFATQVGIPLRRAERVLTQGLQPRRKFLAKVLRAYPQVSPTWLFYGEGEMFLSSLPTMNSGNHIGTNIGTCVQIILTCTGGETINLLQSLLLDKERLIQLLLNQEFPGL